MKGVIYTIIAIVICSCTNTVKQDNLSIFVAASLTNVMNELVDSFRVNNQVKVNLNYASSGILARQITQGATCDIYISANEKWMDYVQESKMILDSSRISPVSNHLVLISPKGEELPAIRIDQLPSKLKGRLSMGDPNHVPAGTYAFEVLNNLGVYTQLENRVLPAKDVRGALMAVEMGECSYGIVYYTDALKSEKVDVLLSIEDSLHSAIDYHMAMIKNNEQAQCLWAFYYFLETEKARLIWEKNGFIVKK
ncbi:molybdate ABC transporter substrate-binding protein [Labilibacter marinus]|uniref:molybdate ABC transporter substrate-binding protein n=1 Tax=Labilibacter marinus TaxID=1477105 RepID=UPI00094FD5A8|nr:molybdate ABC transporter substrate-binding protein [Labilibacter marinus]